MAEFYISRAAVDGTVGHQIHRSDCSQLPEMGTLRYLGAYASGEAVYKKSSNLFTQVSYCPSCFEKP